MTSVRYFRDLAPLTQRVEALLSRLPVLPFEAEAGSHYADIRVALERAGEPIGGNDLLIAAHGLRTQVVVAMCLWGRGYRNFRVERAAMGAEFISISFDNTLT